MPSYSYYPYLYFNNGYELSDPGQGHASRSPVVIVPQPPDVSDLRSEIDRLSRELDSLHDRKAVVREVQPSVAEQPPTLLVFHDQHVEKIYNYAIVGQTLLAFDSQTGAIGRRVPLSELDLAETTQINVEHGVRFSTPTRCIY